MKTFWDVVMAVAIALAIFYGHETYVLNQRLRIIRSQIAHGQCNLCVGDN